MPRKTKDATAKPVSKKLKRSDAGKPLGGFLDVDTVGTLKDLRKATRHTQDDLALAMGVGQGAVSRIEKRDDMLVSTLQHYVAGVGGSLKMLVTFPGRPPLVVERLGKKSATSAKDTDRKPDKNSAGANRHAEH
ncbi:helix-turn-helix domain-containing protein [Quisquiliibacterium transsilvanicum]|uniref:HTH cro/C1-type domain-containing protein n=1 Tax=Quisquiliibacterium transsilvanicum TaxID=1549638 RepID=A0A7W8HKA8_9BURK|nr:helix-turn-helix transcriptional regulator [Quisquiliibacterium transsilvanicum]MBB5273631.1 hypothetical protein [Quisquiliibacterium transsilvanicum]